MPGGSAVDLGCGTGKLTAVLHEKLGLGETLGIDSSPAMLQEADGFAGRGLRFAVGQLETFEPTAPLDLVFSNAALQWAENHEGLLRRYRKFLKPGGWLAVQVPANHRHLSHTAAADVAGEEPFERALGGYRRVSPVLEIDRYAEILVRAGFSDTQVQTRVYLHKLESRDAVVEWVKGTLLTDYQKRLSAELWPKFLERYRQKLLPALSPERPFLYPFLRTLFWARAS
jgi:trans-aconitate 2-methyltransferase